MKVEQILAVKGSNVICVGTNDSVQSAADVLNSNHIGAVVVNGADGKMAGVLSERDIIRAIAEEGGAILSKPVSAIMTANVIVCAPDMQVAGVMAMMTEKRFRHLPVVEGGQLLGMISIGDVVKAKIEETEQEAEALKSYIAAG